MKNKYLGVMILLTGMMAVGCRASREDVASKDEIVKESEQAVYETESEEILGSEAESEYEEIPQDAIVSDDEELPEDEGIGDGGFREVTMQEILELTDFIERMDAYGFLMSEYSIPQEADLGPVFYSGAGKAASMEEDEYTAYLSAMNQEEMFTDCVKVTRSDVEDIVMKRLGLNLDEMLTVDIGVYLSEFDAYYHECGDTNYMKYSCTGGLVNHNVYTVEFATVADNAWEFQEVQTILEKTEEGYRFISNTYLPSQN